MGNLTLNGSTSGGITIAPPAVAGSNTITLPAATGTMALTSSPTFSGTLTATTITSPASTALTIQSAGTTAVTVDTSQNVGIGTTSPTAKLVVNGGTSTSQIRLEVNNAAFTQEVSTNAAASAYVYKSNDASYHVWKLSSSEAMRIDSSGNVGIGTSSPTARLQAYGTSGTAQARLGTANGYLEIAAFDASPVYCVVSGANHTAGVFGTQSNTPTILFTNNTERIRIDTSGNLLVGTTSSTIASKSPKFISYQTASEPSAAFYSNTTANTNQIIFVNPNGEVGNINTNGSTTAYGTSSDYRLKHDVKPMVSGLSTVAALKPVTYKWNVDNSNGEGFIAHELQSVIPFAVTGDKDAIDKEGNIKPQGVDYSKIVVHLVAACQELSAKNDALEAANAAFDARLAALEAK
jgi:hypothetical protein